MAFLAIAYPSRGLMRDLGTNDPMPWAAHEARKIWYDG
jgi:hypothetical protein